MRGRGRSQINRISGFEMMRVQKLVKGGKIWRRPSSVFDFVKVEDFHYETRKINLQTYKIIFGSCDFEADHPMTHL